MRALHLVQGALSTATAWRSLRRPRLVALALAASVAESAWLLAHGWERRGLDEPFPAWVDVAFGVGGLLALAAGTTPEDRTSWVNWMEPLTCETPVLAAMGLRHRDAAAATGVLAATYLATVSGSVRAGGSLLATGLANAISYFGFYIAGDAFVGRLRRSALELEAARIEAVERGTRLATEQERNRQHRLLHDVALQTLEAVAKGWTSSGEAAIRAQAQREVVRLRSALRGDEEPIHTRGIRAGLRAVADEFAAAGLNVELLVIEVDGEPAPPIAQALCDAVREALRNVIEHSGANRAVVRACSVDGMLEVTIRDHGSGLTPEAPSGGVRGPALAAVEEFGGRFEVTSPAGQGTLVLMQVPA